MNKKKREIREMKLDEKGHGVKFTSLVHDPAIQVNWYAFSNEKTVELAVEPEAGETKDEFISRCIKIESSSYPQDQAIAICISKWESYSDKFSKFSTVSEEKRMLAGPLMIPNIKIPRKDDSGEVYDVFFSKETIEIAAKKFFKEKNNLNINEEHTEKVVPGYIVESWLIEDTEKDKSTIYGFSLPVGTWFGIYHIEDQEYWNTSVKTGKVRGFSVEGPMSEELTKFKMQKEITKKFAVVKTKDGGELYSKTDSDMINVGDEIFVMVDDTEQPAADGEYVLDSGKIIVVAAGKVTEIKDAPVEEMAKEDAVAAFKEEVTKSLADILTRLQSVETSISEAAKASEADKATYSKEIENIKKFMSEVPHKGIKATVKEVKVKMSKAEDRGITMESINAVSKFKI